MGDSHHPRRGSLQFWPRSRAKYLVARIRSWAKESKAKPLGFIGIKAGMTHLMVTDNRPKSLSKGESIFMPATIVECPPIVVYGVSFYKKSGDGLRKLSSIMAPKPLPELSRRFPLSKKEVKPLDSVKEFDFLRLLVHTTPKNSHMGSKNPQVLEIALGGNKEEQLKYAQEKLGKELLITEVFDKGNQIDVHGITTGKGFQGTVKRYGVPVRQHKAEKTKRGIATLGGWTPKRIEFTVGVPGKMGYHLRTEYNKQILKISNNAHEINPASGLNRYGIIRNSYLLVKGSLTGPRKRAVVLTAAIRPDHKVTKDAPEITYIHNTPQNN